MKIKLDTIDQELSLLEAKQLYNELSVLFAGVNQDKYRWINTNPTITLPMITPSPIKTDLSPPFEVTCKAQ